MKPLLPFLLLPALFGAEESSRTIQKSFRLTGQERVVTVCGVNAGIQVTAGSGDQATFSVEEKLSAPDAAKLEELKRSVSVDFYEAPGAVHAGIRMPGSDRNCADPDRSGNRNSDRKDRDFWRDIRIHHQFTVTVPKNARIELKTVNGGIEVRQTAGAYKVNTVNGSIKMEDVESAGEVRTVNGGVVAVYKNNPNGETSFQTVNGKLNLYFQPTLNADFTFKTVNGRVFTDFDMAALSENSASATSDSNGRRVIHRRRNHGSLRAGNGGPKVSMQTVNGEILIHSLAKGRP